MKQIDYIYDLIDKSDVTLIGYTFKVERIKDELISKLPCFKLGEISSSFSFKAYMRDIKLGQILDDVKYFKYIILDISDIRTPNDSNKYDMMGKAKIIESVISTIRDDMYKMYNEMCNNDLGSDFDDPDNHIDVKYETPYKLIVTTPMYKSSPDHDINNFTGGSRPMYMSDFAFVIQEPKLFGEPVIKVIKNRHGIENSNISIDGLKEYKYENSN